MDRTRDTLEIKANAIDCCVEEAAGESMRGPLAERKPATGKCILLCLFGHGCRRFSRFIRRNFGTMRGPRTIQTPADIHSIGARVINVEMEAATICCPGSVELPVFGAAAD